MDKAIMYRAKADELEKHAKALEEMLGEPIKPLPLQKQVERESDTTEGGRNPALDLIVAILTERRENGVDGVISEVLYAEMIKRGYVFTKNDPRKCRQYIRSIVSRFRPKTFAEATDGKIRLSPDFKPNEE